MQSQKRPAGMFDKYLKDDSSSGHYVRYDEGDLSDEDLAETAEPIEDESEDKPDAMHAKHMAMMHEMFRMMSEMIGMFSKMLKSAPKKADEDE